MQTPVVIIPALTPDNNLVSLVGRLREEGLSIIVVDDGSGSEYAEIFQRVEKTGCVVVHHSQNLGKGMAIKTGIREGMHSTRRTVAAAARGPSRSR